MKDIRAGERKSGDALEREGDQVEREADGRGVTVGMYLNTCSNLLFCILVIIIVCIFYPFLYASVLHCPSLNSAERFPVVLLY